MERKGEDIWREKIIMADTITTEEDTQGKERTRWEINLRE